MGEAEQTRKPDTQLFHDVFNASPIGIAVENLEGQPLFVNPALCSFLGFSAEELRNKRWADFSPPEDAEKDWALFQQLCAGSIDHYQLEKHYFRRDGSLVWGRLSSSLLKSSPCSLVLAMVEDITDKKKAEDARFRHAAVIESSDDAIASGTLDGTIVTWNTGAQKIYGYTEAEALGKPISMLFPPELPDDENKILETLKLGDRIEHFETVRVTKTGKRINVSLTISPIKDSTGRTVGISGIARDITDRKLAEEALACMNRRVIEAEERERNRIAKDLHENIGQRLALLAIGIEQLKNDFRNRSVELELLDERIDAVWRETLEILTDVKASAHELYSPRLDYLSIAAVMRVFCEECRERKKVEIEFRSHGLPSPVRPEVSICLFRVLQEALDNGVKHSGVQKFSVQLWSASDEIHLTVSDSGAGFDLKAAKRGGGLGLTRMEQRVRLVNGTFSVDSRLEKGTTVHVGVPLGSVSDSVRAAW